MRRTKDKLFKKNLILSLAVLLLSAGMVYAASDWSTLTDETNAAHSQEGGGTVSIDASSSITTNGTAINLGAPPVPGSAHTVTIQGNGSTITAQTPGSGQTSQIFVNGSSDNTLIIEDSNLTGGYAGSGGAVQNANIESSGGETAGGTVIIRGTGDNRVQVTGNTAGRGGAIYNVGDLEIENVDFSDNHARNGSSMPGYSGANYGRGGVIFNGRDNANPGNVVIRNSTFTRNSSEGEGSNSAYSGVIHNRYGTVTIYNSEFGNSEDTSSGNYAKTAGGVLVNQGTVNIYDSSFDYNNAETMGGAIINGLDANDIGSESDAILNISNTAFRNNYANMGGAIYNMATRTQGYDTEANINDGVLFVDNGVRVVQGAGAPTIDVSANGGAIFNNGSSYTNPGSSDAVLNINMDGANNRTVVFQNNVASASGGAIHNLGVSNINNALFQNNGTNTLATGTRTQYGGAIYNSNGNLNGAGETNISNSNFVGNTAQYGGAIYNTTVQISSPGVTTNQGTVTLVDTNFSGNQAINSAGTNVESNGGAIYANTDTVTNIRAQNRDVNIGDYGTSLENGYDTIKLVGTAQLNLDAVAGRNVNLNSTIYGDARTTVINANSGQVNANAPIKDSTINVNGGVLHFEHDRYLAGQKASADNTALNNIVFNGGTMSLLNGELIDQFRAYDLTINQTSNLMLDVDLYNQTMDSILQQNIEGAVSVTNGSKLNISHMASISEARGDNALILFTDVPELIGNVTSNGSRIIEAPIHKYEVTQITQSTFNNRPLGDDYADGEYFQFKQVGDSDSVIAAPVAAQAAFLIQDNLYRQSFANMDMVTLMTPEQRMAWKMRNKYASAGYHTGVYAPNIIPEERDGFYVRPFTNFENVPLKNGPKVSNVSYGMLVGGESDLIDLGHGWDGNFSIFGAYHGSHQAYNGVGIWQNGGTLGAVGTAYKGNFWTGLTANIGASSAEAHTAFGNDGFPILMTGAAWKSGYNWGLLNNKLIIQPSYMMSYTFVNVFDYTNSAGVRITQDPLHAIEIIPGLRIIGNLKNGWQPYIGLNMTWNIMDKTKFYANEVALTPLSIKPYFEYGVGLQKRYGDRFTGFGQAMLRNGGRNGIAFTLGFRWALGH